MKKTDLSIYDNSWFNDGASKLKIRVWYIVNTLFFNCGWNISSGLKISLLKAFRARIGKGVVIKTHVNIKYPWRLSIGDYVWIGEYSWIDNMVEVDLGNNSVLSQGAMLLCGNHDYKKVTFDLMPGKIIIGEGAWVGAGQLFAQGLL